MTRHVDTRELRASVAISSIIGQSIELRRKGNVLMGCCPFHADGTASLSVTDELGLFNCFGCGASGDAIAYVMRLEGVTFHEAADIVRSGTAIGRFIPPISVPTSNVDHSAAARRLWESSREVERSVAQTYLDGRCLRLAELPPLPSLRFAKLSYRGSAEKHPTLVAAITDLDGNVTGVQRTYLTEGGQKLDVGEPKLSLGTVKGGAIRLGVSAEELIVCEGLEDGLSVLRGLPLASVWVAAGAGMIAGMRLPDECSTVTIAADNDGAGMRAAETAATAFQRLGKKTRIMRPSPQFKDFNQELQECQK